MGRYGQLVVGPAGSGKTTYCFSMQNHMSGNKARLTPILVNLDPGQERSDENEEKRPFHLDVRELISVSDVLEELDFGPNGALVFAMEHLVSNLEWLKDGLDDVGGSDDEYFIFDCPGQVELYTHLPVLKTVVDFLTAQCNINLCVVHLIDALFIDDPSKYISGALLALTSMVQLSCAAINVVTKCDLKAMKGGRKRIKDSGPKLPVSGKAMTLDDLEAAENAFEGGDDSDADDSEPEFLGIDDPEYINPSFEELCTSLDDTTMSDKAKRLSTSIANILDNYSLVRFLPLNLTDEESIDFVLYHADVAVQYGEDLEVMVPNDKDEDDDNDGAADDFEKFLN